MVLDLICFHAAIIESLTRKSQLPAEEEFIDGFQKLKFGINLIAKLGHHLQQPAAPQLLESFFSYAKEFVKKTKRYINYIPLLHFTKILYCFFCGNDNLSTLLFHLPSTHVASSVIVPLFTNQSIQMMLGVLSDQQKKLWSELGRGWRTSQ